MQWNDFQCASTIWNDHGTCFNTWVWVHFWWYKSSELVISPVIQDAPASLKTGSFESRSGISLTHKRLSSAIRNNKITLFYFHKKDVNFISLSLGSDALSARCNFLQSGVWNVLADGSFRAAGLQDLSSGAAVFLFAFTMHRKRKGSLQIQAPKASQGCCFSFVGEADALLFSFKLIWGIKHGAMWLIILVFSGLKSLLHWELCWLAAHLMTLHLPTSHRRVLHAFLSRKHSNGHLTKRAAMTSWWTSMPVASVQCIPSSVLNYC